MDEKSYSALRANQRLEPESDFLPHVVSVASALLLHKPHPLGFHSSLRKPRSSGCSKNVCGGGGGKTRLHVRCRGVSSRYMRA